MHQNLNKVIRIFPSDPDFEAIAGTNPLKPFDDEIIALLSEVSSEILKDTMSREYPDVITFGFWCRKASLKALKDKYKDNFNRIGRGVIFHITPSNVPVNFAYSLAAGLLSGNINIVRVPTKEYPQIDIIERAFERVLENSRFKHLVPFVTLLRYLRDESINRYFSSLCDIRVIWGGDSAIEEIRVAPLMPRAFDVTFSDRYSMCVINADEYLKESAPQKLAEGFYNDTYLFDQNACTAPHFVVWLGDSGQVEKGKSLFWNEFYKIVSKKYILQPIQAVDKLAAFYNAAVNLDIKRELSQDNLIFRSNIESLSVNLDKFHCNSGFFLEYTAKQLEELTQVINCKYQTLSYYGVNPQVIRQFVIAYGIKGIDRIVPVGKTTDFSLNWDGYDLIKTFSRVIEVV